MLFLFYFYFDSPKSRKQVSAQTLKSAFVCCTICMFVIFVLNEPNNKLLHVNSSRSSRPWKQNESASLLGKFGFVLLNSGWTEHASNAAQGENKALYVLLFCFQEKSITF